ncbi:MAG: CsgG/HfaB family protein, partial [Verrucomicrobiota bacterium]
MNKAAENMDHLSISLKLGCIFLFLATWNAVGASGTIGVIAIDDQEPARITADLLQDVLTAEDEFQLVERERIEEILTEINLSEAVASPGQRLQLGRITGADFLVLLETLEKEEAHLRVVDCVTGSIAYSADLPISEDMRELLSKTARSMVRQMEWITDTSRSRMIPVSIIPLQPLSPDAASDKQVAESLRHRLRAGLVRSPEVVLLERAELDKARREMENFRGEAADFWNSAVIVTGTAGLQGAELRELFASLTLHLSGGNEVPLKPLVRASSEADGLADDLLAQLMTRLTSEQEIMAHPGFDVAEEIEFLSLLADDYHLRRDYDKARLMLEKVLALQDDKPSKKQRLKIALILQRLPPDFSGNYSRNSPRTLKAYKARMESHIDLLENYVQPWKYKYKEESPVKYDISRFLLNPPEEISEIIEAQRKNPDMKIPDNLTRTINRIDYLRELFRQYILNSRKRISANILLCLWDDPDKIAEWYHHEYWPILLDELFKTLNGELDIKEINYLSWHTHHMATKITQKNGLGNDFQRTELIQCIMSYMVAPNIREVLIPASYPFFNMTEMINELRKINREIFEELCDHFPIDEWSKSYLIMRNANYEYDIASHVRIEYTPDEYNDIVYSLAELLRRHLEKDESHWIIQQALDENYESTAGGELWRMVHSLPPEEQKYWLEKWFFPQMKKYPASPLIDPVHTILRTRDWLSFKKVLIGCEDEDFEEKDSISLPLLKFYLRNKDKLQLDAQGKRILADTLAKAEEYSPAAAAMIKETKRMMAEGGPENKITDKVNWPLLTLDSISGHGQVPLGSSMDGDSLWMLWRGEENFTLTEIDVENWAIVRTAPVKLGNYNIPNIKSILGSGRAGRAYFYHASGGDVQLMISEDEVVVGISSDRSGLRRYAPIITGSINLQNNSPGYSEGFVLSEVIKNATPVRHPSRRMPSPERAAKKLTAFCLYNDYIYFANREGIYALNRKTNQLSLLASDQLDFRKSSLNGGSPYNVHWMAADTKNNRVLIAVHESKTCDSDNRSWGDTVGRRTGIWSYDPDNGEWEQFLQLALGSNNTENHLLLVEDTLFFQDTWMCGKIDLRDKSIIYRSSHGRVAIGENESTGSWKTISALKRLPHEKHGNRYLLHP